MAYPTSFDLPATFTDLMGSFWPGVYGGNALVYNYALGCSFTELQLWQNMQELQDTVGIDTIPPYHTSNWFKIDFFQSQEVTLTGGAKSYPWDPAISADTAVNHIVTPGVAFTRGVEYTIDKPNNRIIFLGSLFQNSALQIEPVVDTNNAVVDYKITLWFYKAQIDKDWIYQQFGHILDLDFPTSQPYKELVHAIWDACVSGTSYGHIARALSAFADVPIVLNDEETIEAITLDSVHRLIITDKNVYKYNPIATPIVTVGQVVHKYDQLTDAVAIYTGVVPPLASLTLGPGFLDPSIAGPLTFSNASTPLIVTLNVSGFTKVEWALGGAPADVTNFFNILHSKGVANGATLANYLDLRPQPQATQPTAASLPATINPMEFLFQNVLKANTFVVIMQPAKFGDEALGLSRIDILRRIIPPHNTMILLTS